MKRSTALAGILAALVAALPLAAAASERAYVVVARGQGRGSTALDDRIAAAQGYVQHRWDELGVIVAASTNPGFAAQVAADPRVHAVAEDVEVQWLPNEPAQLLEPGEVQPAGGDGEPGAAYQWNLRQIGAELAAANGFRGAGARVAVLDSGFWVHHPDLEANVNLALSRSFVPGEPGVEPIVGGFSHGTHVAGIIAAPINGIGVQGVAPEAEIVGVKVLRSTTGSGAFSWILSGILYAVAIEADVINLSLGTTFDRINRSGGGAGPLVAALNRAINHATASGVLVVSAAGNDGVDLNGRLWAIPAQSGGSMAVSATAPLAQHDFDRPASYTNYGQSVINVAAPGGDFLAGGAPEDLILAPGGRAGLTGAYQYYLAAGTSMAAPHVSALAALLVGAFGQTPPAQLRSRIEHSAQDILKPGADPYSGKGRIDVARALGLE
jgi:lantibiotic leader peptide-processing serine protease